MVECESGLKIKKARNNHGDEYKDTIFKKLCYEYDIRIERTVSGTPQHNGIVKKMHKTLTKRAISLLVQEGLPKQMWAKVVNTLTYLINRDPSVPLEHKTSLEVWIEKEIKTLTY